MLKFLSRFRRSAKPSLTFPLEPTDENVTLAMDQRRCFYCGESEYWYEGPSGGMSTNIMCGCCGQKVNYTPGFKSESIGVETSVRRFYEEEPSDRFDRWRALLAGEAAIDRP